MTIQNSKFKIQNLLLLLVVLVVLEIGSYLVRGQALLISPAYAGELDLSLSPSTIEIIAQPGSTVKVPLTLANHAHTTQTITVSFKPFETASDNGEVSFTNQSPPSFFALLKDEQMVTGELKLRPDETASLTLLVDAAEEIRPKDYYITLLFQTKNEQKLHTDQTASKIEAGVGTNIFLSVRDPQVVPTHHVKLAQFRTEKGLQLLFAEEPISFVLRVENNGIHFIEAKAQVHLVDVGGQTVETIESKNQLIPAGSQRNLTSDVKASIPRGFFGRYEARALVIVGDEKLSDSLTLYVIPKHSLILLAVLFFVLFILISRIRLYMLKRQRFAHKSRQKKR